MITAEMVKSLREKTGAGMMDCKKALNETGGDTEKAVVWLREKGLSSAAKKSARVAAEGIVTSYIHMGGRIGVLLEVNCETDFVAKNEDFIEFTRDVAMQIAAMNPKYVSSDEVPSEELEKEKEIYRIQAINEGKTPEIAEKLVEGRARKYYEEVCLIEQVFVKDNKAKVADVLKALIATIGENIVIRRFTRYQFGEGVEKKQENFAEEIAKQISKV